MGQLDMTSAPTIPKNQRDRVEHFRLRLGSRLKRMRVRCKIVLNQIEGSEAEFDIQPVWLPEGRFSTTLFRVRRRRLLPFLW